MKKLIVVLCLLSSSVSFAARNVASYGGKTASINLGMNSSALNIGGRMEFDDAQGALGAYLFLQTEKKDAGIPQVLSFGAHSLLRLVEASNVTAFLAPGIGISMIKMDGADDKTVVGASFRYGAQFKLPNGAGALGIERFEAWNWFDEDTSSSVAFTSAVYSFNF
ncbi:hypothetical protein AB1A81_15320 [Bdellovibrio bacteriovorus]|uniref:Outer membrane protein beta-barrel domain-containing protein n=1 Tax=Bdellovibrio bacteriovorus (strain ATCC 15356 / DSM 50701 / NCIMB 9529 / HD100) TaxID=264462 RepID=Q6MI35_BDEBA|nr:hypothetical protein [Bdellovibrio bacteriovorus]AHZ83709.1 hypothetical protein EP01_01925 [Bdellovibrio bacteriovorus]BEV69681.1 hypothetical protein Bb109J_c3101 [Bdellovibrio bacteriovorus]CAE78147.1 hypothetical protein predicted by Glimmer/Critica [Bdellovibrio bacteriovorus HD100]